MTNIYEVIEKNGKYELGKYECGYYAVELKTKSVGMTIKFTQDYSEAKVEFDRLTKGVN